MATWVCLPTFVPALLVVSLVGAPAPDEKKAPEDLSEMKVRLRLNAIETAQFLEHFGALVKRELGLQDSVRACMKSGDPRLPQYQQALQEAQDDLAKTKKRLTTLESERAKLVERLGTKNTGDVPLESIERANRTLDKILERLSSIEKRLEKLERRK